MSSINFTGKDKKLLNFRKSDQSFLNLFNTTVEGTRQINVTNYIDLDTINVKKNLNLSENTILDNSGLFINRGNVLIDTSKMFDTKGIPSSEIEKIKSGEIQPSEQNKLSFSQFTTFNKTTEGIYFNRKNTNNTNQTIVFGKTDTEIEGGIGYNENFIMDVSGNTRFENGLVDFKDRVNVSQLRINTNETTTSTRVLVLDDENNVKYSDSIPTSSTSANFDEAADRNLTGNNIFSGNVTFTGSKTVDFEPGTNVDFTGANVTGLPQSSGTTTTTTVPIITEPTDSNFNNTNVKVFNDKTTSNIALNSGSYAQIEKDGGYVDVSLNQNDTLNDAFLKSQYWTHFFFLSQPPKFEISNIITDAVSLQFTFKPHHQKLLTVGNRRVMKPEVNHIKAFLIDIDNYKTGYDQLSTNIEIYKDKVLPNNIIKQLLDIDYNPHLKDVYDRNSLNENLKDSLWNSVDNKKSLNLKFKKSYESTIIQSDISLNIIDIINLDYDLTNLNNDNIKLITDDNSGHIINDYITLKLNIDNIFKSNNEARDLYYGGSIGYKHIYDNLNIDANKFYMIALIPSNSNITNYGKEPASYNPNFIICKTKDIGSVAWNNRLSNTNYYVYFDDSVKYFKLYSKSSPKFTYTDIDTTFNFTINGDGNLLGTITSGSTFIITDFPKILNNQRNNPYTLIDIHGDNIVIKDNNDDIFILVNPGTQNPYTLYSLTSKTQTNSTWDNGLTLTEINLNTNAIMGDIKLYKYFEEKTGVNVWSYLDLEYICDQSGLYNDTLNTYEPIINYNVNKLDWINDTKKSIIDIDWQKPLHQNILSQINNYPPQKNNVYDVNFIFKNYQRVIFFESAPVNIVFEISGNTHFYIFNYLVDNSNNTQTNHVYGIIDNSNYKLYNVTKYGSETGWEKLDTISLRDINNATLLTFQNTRLDYGYKKLNQSKNVFNLQKDNLQTFYKFKNDIIFGSSLNRFNNREISYKLGSNIINDASNNIYDYKILPSIDILDDYFKTNYNTYFDTIIDLSNNFDIMENIKFLNHNIFLHKERTSVLTLTSNDISNENICFYKHNIPFIIGNGIKIQQNEIIQKDTLIEISGNNSNDTNWYGYFFNINDNLIKLAEEPYKISDIILFKYYDRRLRYGYLNNQDDTSGLNLSINDSNIRFNSEYDISVSVTNSASTQKSNYTYNNINTDTYVNQKSSDYYDLINNYKYNINHNLFKVITDKNSHDNCYIINKQPIFTNTSQVFTYHYETKSIKDQVNWPLYSKLNNNLMLKYSKKKTIKFNNANDITIDKLNKNITSYLKSKNTYTSFLQYYTDYTIKIFDRNNIQKNNFIINDIVTDDIQLDISDIIYVNNFKIYNYDFIIEKENIFPDFFVDKQTNLNIYVFDDNTDNIIGNTGGLNAQYRAQTYLNKLCHNDISNISHHSPPYLFLENDFNTKNKTIADYSFQNSSGLISLSIINDVNYNIVENYKVDGTSNWINESTTIQNLLTYKDAFIVNDNDLNVYRLFFDNINNVDISFANTSFANSINDININYLKNPYLPYSVVKDKVIDNNTWLVIVDIHNDYFYLAKNENNKMPTGKYIPPDNMYIDNVHLNNTQFSIKLDSHKKIINDDIQHVIKNSIFNYNHFISESIISYNYNQDMQIYIKNSLTEKEVYKYDSANYNFNIDGYYLDKLPEINNNIMPITIIRPNVTDLIDNIIVYNDYNLTNIYPYKIFKYSDIDGFYLKTFVPLNKISDTISNLDWYLSFYRITNDSIIRISKNGNNYFFKNIFNHVRPIDTMNNFNNYINVNDTYGLQSPNSGFYLDLSINDYTQNINIASLPSSNIFLNYNKQNILNKKIDIDDLGYIDTIIDKPIINTNTYNNSIYFEHVSCINVMGLSSLPIAEKIFCNFQDIKLNWNRYRDYLYVLRGVDYRRNGKTSIDNDIEHPQLDIINSDVNNTYFDNLISVYIFSVNTGLSEHIKNTYIDKNSLLEISGNYVKQVKYSDLYQNGVLIEKIIDQTIVDNIDNTAYNNEKLDLRVIGTNLSQLNGRPIINYSEKYNSFCVDNNWFSSYNKYSDKWYGIIQNKFNYNVTINISGEPIMNYGNYWNNEIIHKYSLHDIENNSLIEKNIPYPVNYTSTNDLIFKTYNDINNWVTGIDDNFEFVIGENIFINGILFKVLTQDSQGYIFNYQGAKIQFKNGSGSWLDINTSMTIDNNTLFNLTNSINNSVIVFINVKDLDSEIYFTKFRSTFHKNIVDKTGENLSFFPKSNSKTKRQLFYYSDNTSLVLKNFLGETSLFFKDNILNNPNKYKKNYYDYNSLYIMPNICKVLDNTKNGSKIVLVNNSCFINLKDTVLDNITNINNKNKIFYLGTKIGNNGGPILNTINNNVLGLASNKSLNIDITHDFKSINIHSDISNDNVMFLIDGKFYYPSNNTNTNFNIDNIKNDILDVCYSGNKKYQNIIKIPNYSLVNNTRQISKYFKIPWSIGKQPIIKILGNLGTFNNPYCNVYVRISGRINYLNRAYFTSEWKNIIKQYDSNDYYVNGFPKYNVEPGEGPTFGNIIFWPNIKSVSQNTFYNTGVIGNRYPNSVLPNYDNININNNDLRLLFLFPVGEESYNGDIISDELEMVVSCVFNYTNLTNMKIFCYKRHTFNKSIQIIDETNISVNGNLTNYTNININTLDKDTLKSNNQILVNDENLTNGTYFTISGNNDSNYLGDVLFLQKITISTSKNIVNLLSFTNSTDVKNDVFLEDIIVDSYNYNI